MAIEKYKPIATPHGFERILERSPFTANSTWQTSLEIIAQSKQIIAESHAIIEQVHETIRTGRAKRKPA